MSYPIPTAKQTAALVLGFIEARINQVTPLLNKAYNRVISGSQALATTSLFKFAADRAVQNLASTATDLDSLKDLGDDRNIPFKDAVAAVVEVDLIADTGVSIPFGASFIADQNGLRYFNNSTVVAAAGVATLQLTCGVIGAVGNLQNGGTLSIGAKIDNANTTATVTSTITTGADAEDKEAYRARVLSAQRLRTGGGNAADYKIWSEAVTGVEAAYPFAGRPFDASGTPSPPERTVYVEADSGIDPDGIAPPALLADVRTAITTDPATGLARQQLGLTDDTLFVESIVRDGVFIQINGLQVDAGLEVQAKADVKTALEAYLLSVVMFVDGVDFVGDRNDTITNAVLGGVVSDALIPTSGTIVSVNFGFDVSVVETRFQLRPGQLVNLAADPAYV